MMMRSFSMCLLLVLLSPVSLLADEELRAGQSSARAGAGAEYVIVEVGALGAGPSETRAINGSGEIVGFSLTGETSPEGSPVRRSFLWLPTPAYGLAAGLHDLGTLRTDPLGSSEAFDITDLGQVVGRSETDDTNQFGDPVSIGFSWLDGALAALPTPSANTFSLTARSANAAGEVGITVSLGFGCQAFLWLPEANYGLAEGFNQLPALDGLFEARVGEINGQGQITGQSTGACDALGGQSPAFLWLPEPAYGFGAGIHEISPSLPEGSDAMGVGLNESGQVVGVIDDYLSPATGFLWDQGAMTTLSFEPTAINESGWIVGNSAAGPVLWRSGSLQLLADLVVAGSGWTLQRASDINDHGQIAATGANGGQVRALLLETVEIFADGFESGSTVAWDSASPSPTPF